jgi:hypothetical protein
MENGEQGSSKRAVRTTEQDGHGTVARKISDALNLAAGVTPRILQLIFFLFFTRQKSGVTFSFSFYPR